MDAPDQSLLIIFGATGDLAGRKLLPALYRLSRQNALGEHFRILGISRNPDMDDAGFRAWTAEALERAGVDQAGIGSWCERHLFFHTAYEPGHYDELAVRIREVEQSEGLPGNRAYYLALPPQAFAGVIENLGRAELARSPGWTRVVIEKPFGRDLASARALNEVVHRWFDETQIYRIDHFLGKETVQNLLVFRFANAVFESVWNRDRVDHVQITVAEDLGIGTRGGYYEQAGAMRDMVQNHLTQLMTLIAMEVPVAYDPDAVRFEKIKALRSIATIDPVDVVFGQYTSGNVDGERVPGYLQEKAVAKDSLTETFVAMRIEPRTWRWQDVPFYLRTGKRMPKRSTEIAVVFRRPPVHLFESLDCQDVSPNILRISIQPNEGFAFSFEVKAPGEPLRIRHVPLDFQYADAFEELPAAYETLLVDVLQGEQTLFVHADEVEESWRLYSRIVDDPPAPAPYAAGTWGPPEADELLARDGRSWII